MMSAWEEVKQRFPIGSRVVGKVSAHHPFGIIVDISDPIALGLVQITDFLDDGRDAAQDFHDGRGLRAIRVHPRAHKYPVRAEPAGGARRHGGMDFEFPRLVAGRADDAALIRRRADDDGPAAVFGMIALFDRGEERVHIHMENDARRGFLGRGIHGWRFSGDAGECARAC